MPWEYNYENHDWDMTLKAAGTLAAIGESQPKGDDRTIEFASCAGGMLMSFAAVESFTNSVAFSLSRGVGKDGFDYKAYLKENSFWGRVDKLLRHLEISTEREKQPLLTIEEMRKWRNSLVHTSPFAVETTTIDTPNNPPPLSEKLLALDYARSVNPERARQFYQAAFDYIQTIISISGVHPKTYVSYREIDKGEATRIERQAVKMPPR